MLTSTWRKSRRSEIHGACVEARRDPGGTVSLRDSRDPGGPTLTFTPEAWTALLSMTPTRFTPEAWTTLLRMTPIR